jgi:hypothetical protein
MPPKNSTRTSKPKPPKPGEPRLSVRRPQRMAVVMSKGDPNRLDPALISSLYGAVYQHKFSLKKAGLADFKVAPLVARWPDAGRVAKSKWTGLWAVPVPAGTRKLRCKPTDYPVRLETWNYGPTVAEILHIGPYSEEGPSIQKLMDFIGARGYEIAGSHEEEYLTRPDAKVMKTIIRYPVRRRVRSGKGRSAHG